MAHEASEKDITLDWIIEGGNIKATDAPQVGHVLEKGAQYIAQEEVNKINYIHSVINTTPLQRDIIYNYLNKGKNKTLFEKIKHLSDDQIDLIFKLINNLKA